jgi:S-adenosyl-L-methionine hydrolase (adenosine-forming)
MPNEPLMILSPLPIVTFLTDFGHDDSYVGVVKGVMLGICPGLHIVDLTHHVPPQDIQEGAFQLLTAVPHLPAGSIHLAVVDPGVGTDRRAVAVRVGEHTFVGPDNGLLSWIVGRLLGVTPDAPTHEGVSIALEPPAQAVELTEPRFWRHPVAPTFHARDIFGPVAAALAQGRMLEEMGQLRSELVNLSFPRPQTQNGRLQATIIQIDRFGNLTTNLAAFQIPRGAKFRVRNTLIGELRLTYGQSPPMAEDPSPIALVGSAGFLEIAMPGGNAADRLHVRRGDVVEVISRSGEV